uniref:Fucosyltransferase n=1 Tax=Phallusia mammillata TaxID=59560 RepID=A0A6F9DDS0_9ASCI|nr:alpha-(1,3)-fucosyltransferase 7-like [Phallusia mammillata]
MAKMSTGMNKSVRQKTFVSLCAALFMYLWMFLKYDKYIYETLQVTDDWMSTSRGFKQDRKARELFTLDKKLLQVAGEAVAKLILIWTPYMEEPYTDPVICPGCVITYDRSAIDQADAVVFHFGKIRDSPSGLPWKLRKTEQRWVWLSMEPPWHVRHLFQKTLTPLNGVFNWTMSYRHDSDVYTPFVMDFSEIKKPKVALLAEKNASSLGAWMVSNCHPTERRQLIGALREHVTIDEYGVCSGRELCHEAICQRQVLSRYKFYFALENSRCQDYITEKFWVNALGSRAVPVVMGTTRANYEAVAPPHSFIHVDDFATVEDLAAFLKHLDQNDEEYLKYFDWWETWKQGKFPKPREDGDSALPWMCPLCEKLHKTDSTPKSEKNLDTWWFGNGYNESNDALPICDSHSGPSAFETRWMITLAYSAFYFIAVAVVFSLIRRSRLNATFSCR